MSTEVTVESSTDAQTLWRWQSMAAALLLMAVELIWVIPWLRLLGQYSLGSSVWKMTLILAMVLFSAYLVSLGAETLYLLRNVRLGALGVLLALQLFLAPSSLIGGRSPITTIEGILRLDAGFLLTAAAVLWLWRRGATLGEETLRPMVAWGRFSQGLLAQLAYIFIDWRTQSELSEAVQRGQNGFFLFGLYLFVGLMAVTMTRVAYVSVSVSRSKNPFDWRWLFSIGGALGLVVMVAVLAGSLLTGQFRLLLQAVSVVLRGALVIVLFLFGLPSLLFSFLFMPLISWIQNLPRATPAPDNEQLMPGGIYPLYPMEGQSGPPPLSLQALCLFGALALIVILVYLSTRKTLSQKSVILPEGPESLLESGEASRLARQALRDWFEGMRQRLSPKRELMVAARVRQIYAQLLQLCAELNAPRPDSATPLEFLPVMTQIFPAREQDLETITQLYLQVRYGEYPETFTEVQKAEVAWQRIAEEGERLRKTAVIQLAKP